MKYIIRVSGCDDETQVEMDLTADEATLVTGLAEAITTASTYRCQPRMSIEVKP